MPRCMMQRGTTFSRKTMPAGLLKRILERRRMIDRAERSPVSPESIAKRLEEISDEELVRRQEVAENFVNASEEERENVWLFVSSEAIAGVKFVPNTETSTDGSLFVLFHTGNIEYELPNVPRSVFHDFMYSASKGKFWHEVLQPQYSIGVGANHTFRIDRS